MYRLGGRVLIQGPEDSLTFYLSTDGRQTAGLPSRGLGVSAKSCSFSSHHSLGDLPGKRLSKSLKEDKSSQDQALGQAACLHP